MCLGSGGVLLYLYVEERGRHVIDPHDVPHAPLDPPSLNRLLINGSQILHMFGMVVMAVAQPTWLGSTRGSADPPMVSGPNQGLPLGVPTCHVCWLHLLSR